MKTYVLASDGQDKYETIIDQINKLLIDNDDKQSLIDRVDDLVDWFLTSDEPDEIKSYCIDL